LSGTKVKGGKIQEAFQFSGGYGHETKLYELMGGRKERGFDEKSGSGL